MNLAGIGIRSGHLLEVLEKCPAIPFFEAHSENYFGDSPSREKLLKLREQYPLSLHGVGLSLGRSDRLDIDHLNQLDSLVTAVKPYLVSEHLAWSAFAHNQVPDLLPLPLNWQSMSILVGHVQEVQDKLGCQVLIENPSNYLLFDEAQIPEPEFLNLLAQTSGCGLLVDVNNVYISCHNLGRDAKEYLQLIDSRFIRQYHLAGHTSAYFGGDKLLLDTHNRRVAPPVWDLFKFCVNRHGQHPTVIEWDSDLPAFDLLVEEAQIAATYLDQNQAIKGNSTHRTGTSKTRKNNLSASESSSNLESHQRQFLQDIYRLNKTNRRIAKGHQSRLQIYQDNTFKNLADYLQEIYPATVQLLGSGFFRGMVQEFIQSTPLKQGNIHGYGGRLESFIRGHSAIQNYPYMGDLVALEWMLHRAYYADSSRLRIENSKTLPQQQLLTTALSLNESVRLLSSPYSIYDLWYQSRPGYEGELQWQPEPVSSYLVVFKQATLEVKQLNEAEYSLLSMFQSEMTLNKALAELSARFSEQELATALSLMLQFELMREAGSAARTPKA